MANTTTKYGKANTTTKLSTVDTASSSDISSANMLCVSNGNVKQLPGYIQQIDKNKNDIASMMLKIYPVGSIYISVNTTNPGTLFGGTWEQIKDRFILAAGGSYTVGSTGGEATHTLTVNEMPRHSHDRIACQNYYLGDKGLPSNGTAQSAALITTSGASNQSAGYYGTIPSGGSAAHNNMPPYLAVYMWKRTA